MADSGLLSCLDAKTGAVRWTETLGRPHTASSVYAGGLVYLLAEDGTATVFRPGSSYDEVTRNKPLDSGAKFQVLASYAVDGNALFLRTAKALYRIEKK